jgi:hypothetical protein
MPKPPLAAILFCAVGLGAPAVHAQGRPVPQGREPGSAPYDPFAQRKAAPPSAAPAGSAASGFRITVPLCRRAERTGDPLAKTAECAALLKAAEDQAKACRQAFEGGDDKAAMSPACRQAAGFR